MNFYNTVSDVQRQQLVYVRTSRINCCTPNHSDTVTPSVCIREVHCRYPSCSIYYESENIMSEWLASQIKVNEEAGVDPDELKAILRFLEKMPAVVRDYAKVHDPDETLQWLKALYNFSKVLSSLTGHAVEVVMEQVQVAIRSGNLPVFTAQGALGTGSAPASQQQQPEPTVVSELLDHFRNLLGYAGVDLDRNDTLNAATISGFVNRAQKKRTEFDEEMAKITKERDELKKELEDVKKATKTFSELYAPVLKAEKKLAESHSRGDRSRATKEIEAAKLAVADEVKAKADAESPKA